MPRLSLSRPRRVETTVQVDNKGHTEKPRPGRSTRKAHRTRRSRSSHGLAHAEHALVQAIGLPRLSSRAETCRGYRRALVQVEERRGERPKSARSRRDTQMLSFRPTRPARRGRQLGQRSEQIHALTGAALCVSAQRGVVADAAGKRAAGKCATRAAR